MAAITTTLTIEGLDPQTRERLDSEAKRRGISLPVLAGVLLKQSIDASGNVYHDLDFLAGTWSEAEANTFDAASARTREIDPELWK
jgi:hypothetical protein